MGDSERSPPEVNGEPVGPIEIKKAPGPLPEVRGYQPGFASYCLPLGTACKREFSLRVALWWLPFADMYIFL